MNAPLVPPAAVRTTCPYCGVGCGVSARASAPHGARITGDPDHPANSARLCSKGFALDETLGLGGRLLHPMQRDDGGTLRRVSWETALDGVAEGLSRTIERHGPGAVAFYLSGQLLTEDYYIANKLMKGFIGSPHVDTNSRLCMASTVAGHRRAFGGDVVPGCYDDLDIADLIVLVGSNTAWCHPVLYQRMIANRAARGSKIVVIDPRQTPTGTDADLFLPIAPGMDSILFAGLLVHLAERDGIDRAYVDAHTTGFAQALDRAREIARSPAITAGRSGLAEHDVVRFFNLFLETPRTVTCFSQGVNQSAQGTDKVNAIINCHLATGRIGREGMGPFSLTGQPNAMGGREVGGLANMLAAHMAYGPENVDRVRRFWNAPNMAEREGLKAVAMFEAIDRGEIKALWVMGTNPAASLPRAGAMRDALRQLELFVVSENVLSNDTMGAQPHFALPAAAWGEKDGTVTNSERRISRQRAFLPLPGAVRPDWRILRDVAQRLGHGAAFSYRTVADIFREHAALSAFENHGTRGFDIGALSSLTDAQYEALEPMQWPCRKGEAPTARLFADGGFFTPDRKARFVAPDAPALRQDTTEDFPLRLNTGRIRDQWHTMTRTGASPILASHTGEPFVEIHPRDASRHHLRAGRFAAVHTAHGTCVLRVVVSAQAQPGSIFVPIHWSDTTASAARTGDLVAPCADPHSGQPEAKATPAAVSPVEYAFAGLLLTREPITPPVGLWWARIAVDGAAGLSLAGQQSPAWWRERAPMLFPGAVLTEYADLSRGLYRAAAFVDGRLEGALYIGHTDHPPRWADLAIATDGATARTDPVVCACFGVGADVIRHALASRRAATAEEIGRALRAGTKCGSCLPELRHMAATGVTPSSSRLDHAHAS